MKREIRTDRRAKARVKGVELVADSAKHILKIYPSLSRITSRRWVTLLEVVKEWETLLQSIVL